MTCSPVQNNRFSVQMLSAGRSNADSYLHERSELLLNNRRALLLEYPTEVRSGDRFPTASSVENSFQLCASVVPGRPKACMDYRHPFRSIRILFHASLRVQTAGKTRGILF